jgi:hypothetical protein
MPPVLLLVPHHTIRIKPHHVSSSTALVHSQAVAINPPRPAPQIRRSTHCQHGSTPSPPPRQHQASIRPQQYYTYTRATGTAVQQWPGTFGTHMEANGSHS